jgi:hypothetical protein
MGIAHSETPEASGSCRLGTGSVEEFDGNISTSEAENEPYVTDTK